MTTVTALIPRVRRDLSGHVIAVRCTTCGIWRKPHRFSRDAVTCRRCPYGRTGRHLTTHAAKRR